ncbi:hypothetical protein TCAL_13954, partial [Tigriopus californicus]|eukprot:TCALIF_13954-PA protein Name:"Protein of unknown function" AED:0.37 eAED:0.37 QI:105/0.5/0.33/0.66/0/0/3/0/122
MLKEAFILASLLTVWSLCGTFFERGVVAQPAPTGDNANTNLEDKYYYEDSYDYYETEEPAQVDAASFDLSELVTAWKEYYECNIKGEEKEELCPDGFAFDIKSENCDYPTKVNCTGRPELRK